MKDIEVLENITETYIDVDNAAVDIENSLTEVYAEQLETNVNIDDENVVEIEISEAFPFSSEGVLDSTFKDKDVLIDGGEVDGANDEAISIQTVLENCAALGGLENISHGALSGREMDGQHPISAIEGLREELDNIATLKTVYSNGKGIAQYYMWNERIEDNIGHFVTKLSNDTIKIIDDANEDIFGVVVNDAGFICNQDDTPRDSSYGLVVYAGEVDVRCELDVKVGDYVISNDAGYAKKSTGGKGYKVTAVYKPHDTSFATISLVLSANQINDLGENVQDLSSRMTKAEADVTQAINTAQTAYNMALAGGSGNAGSINASTVAKAEEALDKAESALTATENMSAQVQGAVQSAAQAKKIASDALASASSIKTEAVEKSNQALEDAVTAVDEVKKLKDDMKPLSEWKDEEGNSSFAGFVAKSNEDSAILADMVEWQGEVNGGKIESIASISRKADANESKISALTDLQTETNKSIGELQVKSSANGAYIRGFVANIDKYSYGKYSQANRFTYEEALNVLELEMIYVPSEDHEETYEESKNYVAVTYRFDKGRYYTWSTSTNEQGETIRTWVGSNDTSVKFSSAYVTGNTNAPYWVAEADVVVDEKVAYEKDCLYKWENELWIKVATLKGNLGAVTTSILTQTSNSIETAVTNVKGDYAGTKSWVESNKAAIQDVVSWHNDNGDSLVTFMQEAGDKFASASQVAQIVDKDGNIKEASIMTVVKDNISSVDISADQITMTGTTTFLKPEDVGKSGTTVIDGSRITTGSLTAGHIKTGLLQSEGYTDNNSTVYSDSGTCFNLNDGSITAPNFAVSSSGVLNAKNATIEGSVIAASGSFTGTINAEKGELHDLTLAGCLTFKGDSDYYIDANTNGDTYYVNLPGIQINATDAEFSGNLKAPSGTIGGFNIDKSGKLYYAKTAYNDVENDGVYIGTDGIGLGKGTFFVDSAGSITTKQGEMGGWTIKDKYIISENQSVGLYSYDDSDEGLDVDSHSSYVGKSLLDNTNRTIRFFAGASNTEQLASAPFKVLSDGSLYASAAKISGTVNATDGELGDLTVTGRLTFGGNSDYYIDANENDNSYYINLPGFQVDDTSGAVFSGNLSAPSGDIGGFTIDDSGKLYYNKSSHNDTKNGVYLGTDGIGLGAGAFYVNSSGEMFSIKGKIGGWEITSDWLKSDGSETGVYCGMYSGNYPTDVYTSVNKPSLVTPGTYSNGRFYAGASAGSEAIYDSKFTVLDDGSLYASAAKLGNGNLGESDSILLNTTDMTGVDGFFDGTSINNWRLTVGNCFGVTSNGSLYAKRGTISCFDMDDEGLSLFQNNQRLSISTRGIVLTGGDFEFDMGNLKMSHTDETGTVMSTSGALVLRGANNTEISLMQNNEGATTTHFVVRADFLGERGYEEWTSTEYAKIKFYALDQPPYYPFDVEIWYEIEHGSAGSVRVTYSPTDYGEKTKSIILNQGLQTNRIRFKTMSTGQAWSDYYYFNALQNGEMLWNGLIVGSEQQTRSASDIVIKGDLLPYKDPHNPTGLIYTLGDENHLWGNIFVSTEAISESDKNVKNTIMQIDESYCRFFDTLKPVTYKFNKNQSNRTHIGFIAQDVKDSLISARLTTQDFAGYCEWTKDNGEIGCGLRYSEFIALCVNEIQKLKKRVAELENK